MKNIAVFDIDGVLADFEGFLVDFLSYKHPKYGGINRHLYSLKDRYAECQGDVIKDAMSFWLDPNSYYGLDAIESGFDLLKQTIDQNLFVLFLSSRPESSLSYTERWLRKELRKRSIDYKDTLGLVLVSNKAAYLMKYKGEISFFVDDNPEEIEDATNFGIPAFSFPQLWNEECYPKIIQDGYGNFNVQYSDGADDYFWNVIEV